MKTTILWQGIEIEITYTKSYSKAYHEIYGYPLSHIEIRAKEALPVTETGYYSHFSPAPSPDDFADMKTFICEWLDEEAKSPEWKNRQEACRQYSLF